MVNRRGFNAGLIGTSSASLAMGAVTKAAPLQAAREAGPDGGKRLQIGMIIFDGMTNLDFVGPHDTLSAVRQADTHVLAKTRDPVTTDRGLKVLPHMALDESPDLDILFIGGGAGATALMEDREMIDFLARQGRGAAYVTSVCTGALVLGAAGLLRGYRAATHWAAMDVLPLLGAIPVQQRVVVDRNRITGGGVTAGIDFGLTLVAEIWGEDQARMIQLAIEYDPQPPFDSGSPRTATPELVTRMRKVLEPVTNARVAAAKRIQARNA